MAQNKVWVKDLQRIEYQKAWALQEEYFKTLIDHKVATRKAPREAQHQPHHYLLFCEHPHVYTLGRSGDQANLLLDNEGLTQHDASFVKINRGGDITYHGLGQVVGYPIFDLDDFFTDIGRYIRYLEEAVIRCIAEYGIQGERIKGLSGVWIDAEGDNPRKICAVGVHLSRWVTMHGFALNVNTDLSYFGHIVPCGITDKGVTSIQQELGHEVSMDEVKAKLLHHFMALFEFEPIHDIV